MRNSGTPTTLLLNDDAETYADPASFAPRDHWFGIIEKYSKMHLPRETDRLPAIAGLARSVEPRRGHYVAGIWERDMPAALLWMC